MITDWTADLRGDGGWVWHDGMMTERQDMALLFGECLPPPMTRTIRLHVSADNRYLLFADPGDGGGARKIGRGPARGDPQHTSLDPYVLDRTAETHGPMRIWAAVRWNAGKPQTPIAEMHTQRPGFLLIATFHDEKGTKIGRSATGKDWKVCRTNAITDHFSYAFPNWVWLGAYEHHRAEGWPADWLGGEVGELWKPAHVVEGIYFKGDPPWQSAHWLVPRAVPEMCQTPGTFLRMAPANDFSRAAAPAFPVRVAAGETRSFVFDAGETTNAYPLARLSGAGSTIKLTYAEVMRTRGDGGVTKHFSLQAGSDVEGPCDVCVIGGEFGGRVHEFETFHWRSFRFIRMDITAGAAGATLHEFAMSLTGYPLDRKIAIEAEGPAAETVKQIIDVSWRTLDRCSWETFMDCPFYEQLQYIGDARLEALQLYVAGGDWTLAREALRAFDRSRLHEGLSQSCYPSSGLLFIPPFSLLQVLMADDYLQYSRDESLIEELRPGLAQILEWFEKFIEPDTGLLGATPYWPFVDWVDGWKAGMPPSPCNALINLHYLLALQSGQRLALPRPAGSASYAGRSAQLRRKIRETFWDASLGVLCDEPAGARSASAALSQHAQALGTLAGVLSRAEARRALKYAIEGHPTGLAFKPTSYYFRFYLAEAVARVGWGAAFWQLLEPFLAALSRGSTTWPEMYEPARSECHAFSGWPMYFLSRHVLGVCPPDANGEIAIRPLHCAPLERISGTVMTHRGAISVWVAWNGRIADVRVAKDWT